MTLTKLEKAIVRTIAYFDILEYPLTQTEVWKWLHRPELTENERSLSKVREALEQSRALAEVLSLTEAFYTLRGREHLVPVRKMRNLNVDRQIQKVVRMTKLMRLIPSVKMIAIYSSLAIGNVKEQSDIDLFIVAKKNQIWWTRFLIVGLLKLLRQRPTAQVTRDKLCLSFYVTEDNLDISAASFGHDDIAYRYYVANFIPVYDPDHIYETFLRKNAWWERDLPNAYFPQQLLQEVARPAWLVLWHRLFEWVSWPLAEGPLSDWCCNLQLRIMPSHLKALANIDVRVIISDRMLKFHNKDTRVQQRKAWLDRIAAYE
ncbi:MAG: nucleotidyltransferase domain-containing protein [Patescibacteria group bacterium]